MTMKMSEKRLRALLSACHHWSNSSGPSGPGRSAFGMFTNDANSPLVSSRSSLSSRVECPATRMMHFIALAGHSEEEQKEEKKRRRKAEEEKERKRDLGREGK